MRAARQSKGIFCIEGIWEADLRTGSTVRPLLELLRLNAGIPYIHRECATGVELEFYLSKWVLKSYSKYPILYLASHGDQFGIKIADGFYDLDSLAEFIGSESFNRIVVISSCSTLNVDKRNLRRFVESTGCLAICGYKADVDWMRSAAFELLLLYEMQENEFSGRGISAIERKTDLLSKSFPDLQYRIVTNRMKDSKK